MTATYANHTSTRQQTREQKAATLAADIAAGRQATEAHLAAFRAQTAHMNALHAAGASEAAIWSAILAPFDADPRTPAERERDAAAEDWQQQVRDLRASL